MNRQLFKPFVEPRIGPLKSGWFVPMWSSRTPVAHCVTSDQINDGRHGGLLDDIPDYLGRWKTLCGKHATHIPILSVKLCKICEKRARLLTPATEDRKDPKPTRKKKA